MLPGKSLLLYRGLGLNSETSPDPLNGVVVEYAGMRGKSANTPTNAVFYSAVWTPVDTKPHKNTYQLAYCYGFGCLSQPHGCIHAKRGNSERRNKATAASSQASEALLHGELTTPVSSATASTPAHSPTLLSPPLSH